MAFQSSQYIKKISVGFQQSFARRCQIDVGECLPSIKSIPSFVFQLSRRFERGSLPPPPIVRVTSSGYEDQTYVILATTNNNYGKHIISFCPVFLTGLLAMIATIVYISTFKAEVKNKLRARNIWDPPRFTYRFGYSFYSLVVGFIMSELTGKTLLDGLIMSELTGKMSDSLTA